MIKATLTCLALAVPAALVAPGAAMATGSPGCVTEAEYVHADKGMTKAKVAKVFGTRGELASGSAGGFTRSYARCGSSDGTVLVTYRAPKRKTPTVYRMVWGSPTEGDVSVLKGTDKGNSFDLVNRPVRQNHVYAGNGNDYIFMQANGYRDVIRCGPGRDLVQYLDVREAQDVYIGCEQVMLYSP